MNYDHIRLSVANRPTAPGLYVMQEYDFAVPRLVTISQMHIAGEDSPRPDLMCTSSEFRSCAPLNEEKSDGGRWQWSITKDAKFSLPLQVTVDENWPPRSPS
jgi:hypothetical protein